MSRVALKRKATCHPDEPHEAHGLCYACYQMKYRRKSREAPQRRYKVMPEFPPDYIRILPRRTPGVRQNAVTSFPISGCPHCLSTQTITYQGREARCAGLLGGCGHTVFLVREGVDEAKPLMPPRVGAGEYLHA